MSQLSDYFDALKTAIESGLLDPHNAKCEYLELEHGNPEKRLRLPLVLIGCGNIEQIDELDNIHEMVFELSLEAQCILPAEHCDDVHAMQFAMETLAIINRNDFDLNYVHEPTAFNVTPGDFTSVKLGYESRVVTWRQMLTLNLADPNALEYPWQEVTGTAVLSGNTEPTHTQTIVLDT